MTSPDSPAGRSPLLDRYLDTLRTLLRTPTAPYREGWMIAVLENLLSTIPGLEISADQWGNRFARLRRGECGRACLACVAHLDHPGLVIDHVDGKRVDGTLEGGVAEEYLENAAVRLYRSPGDRGIAARVTSFEERRDWPRFNCPIRLEAEEEAVGALLGMWDLEPFAQRDGLVHGRAIDDLAGVALIVETLRTVSLRDDPVDLMGIFTVAEEPGARGAILLCREEDGPLPPDARVISIEASSQRTGAAVGDGAILRVGDKSTVFDPTITAQLHALSSRFSREAGIKPLVRALMDGGNCEASVFNCYGWNCGGLCLPLGNYHNMDAEKRTLAQEFISLEDAESLLCVMVEISVCELEAAWGIKREQLDERGSDAARRLPPP